jgi:SsrA-binding protein
MSVIIKTNDSVLAVNRRARFDYLITETFEAGLMLTGSEVKSLRAGKVQLGQAYAGLEGEVIKLFGLYIDEYPQSAPHLQHDPRRNRTLLLNKKQINKMTGAIGREGMTLIPIKLYFNKRGKVKIELGLAKGKKNVDKRDTTKERDWNRDKGRIMKANQHRD